MKGAREYAKYFKTGQYGKLYITSSYHARGKTFEIQVLPEGEEAIPNGDGNKCLNKDAITVYDVISGQRGWTEVYGWIYQGKWVDDFNDLLDERKEEQKKQNELCKKENSERKLKESTRKKDLLNNY